MDCLDILDLVGIIVVEFYKVVERNIVVAVVVGGVVVVAEFVADIE